MNGIVQAYSLGKENRMTKRYTDRLSRKISGALMLNLPSVELLQVLMYRCIYMTRVIFDQADFSTLH